MAFKYTKIFFKSIFKILKFIFIFIIFIKIILFSLLLLSIGYYIDAIISFLSEFLFFMSYVQDLLDMLPKP